MALLGDISSFADEKSHRPRTVLNWLDIEVDCNDLFAAGPADDVDVVPDKLTLSCSRNCFP